MIFFSFLQPLAAPMVFLLIVADIYFSGLIVHFTEKLPHLAAILDASLTCSNCGNRLKLLESLPLISHLIGCGKCKKCAKHLNFRSIPWEIGTLIVDLILLKILGLSWSFVYFMLLSTASLLISYMDIKYLTIPLHYQILFGFFCVIYILFSTADPLLAMGYGFIYYGIMVGVGYVGEKIAGRKSIGSGDMFLIALCGSVLGGKSMLPFFLLISTLGIFSFFIWKKLKKQSVFPFAPAILLAFYGCVLTIVR